MLPDSIIIEKAKPLKITQRIGDTDGLMILDDSSNQNYDNFARDVLEGLKAEQKFLSPKYFYDRKGSELFVKITQTDDYYPTRTEESILNHYSPEIVEECNQVNRLVELGSGSSEKTDIILNEFHKKRKAINYIPIDVSDIIINSGKKLLKKYDSLSVTGIVSDYERGLSIVSKIESRAKLVLFLGSSIGNFEPLEIKEFLTMTRQSLNQEDFILIGFDLVKDRDILYAAYNDGEGITKDFNFNILARINRELDANFDLNKFEHSAFYNENQTRIEMHLVSKENQTVTIGALKTKISLKKNETIHTENSHKFTHNMIRSYTEDAGLEVIKTWTDPKNYFSLYLLRKQKLI
jgi:dimethylhistidine N-methyltransferase